MKKRRSYRKRNARPTGRAALTDRLSEVNKVVSRWFYQPDLQALRIVMGDIASHYINAGDPAWLLLVAPPGTGKTTVAIMAGARLPQVVPLGAFTSNTFLSGFYGKRETGILEKLGTTTEVNGVYTTSGDGILLAKDFTTVLSMRRETRGEILGQLREIHDGEYRRSFGTGETKIWNGRITLIAAVTPAIDRYYSVFSTLGERFLQIRWHRPRSPRAGQRAIRQQGREQIIREELQSAIKNVFDGALNSAPKMDAKSEYRIASLAEMVAIARTHVYRNNFGNREIEYAPEAEANTRISKGLASIAKGIAALNNRRDVGEQELQDVFRVGLDSISDNRRRLLLGIVQGAAPQSIGLPRTVMTRELEELEALALITSNKSGVPQASKQTSRLLRTAGVIVNDEPLLR